MWSNIIHTRNDWTATIIRVALGIVILAHGSQKLLGWFGGPGFGGTLDFFQSIGVPAVIGILTILTETVGAVALILGLGGRIVAAGIVAIMLGAVFMVHLHNGFFMNWGGTQAGEGFEFHILAVAMALALLVKGSGSLSVDRAFAARARTG